MTPAAPPVLRATRLLDQIRERICYKHYSLRTELVPYPVGFVHHQMTALRVLSEEQLRVDSAYSWAEIADFQHPEGSL